MSSRYVVIGGAGFIGSALANSLIANGKKVCVIDRLDRLRDKHSLLQNDIEKLALEYLSKPGLLEKIRCGDIVFHPWSETGPQSSSIAIGTDIGRNLIPSIELLDACLQVGIKKIVFVSSGAVYGNVRSGCAVAESHPTEPISSYGIVKLAVEKYLSLYKRLFGLEYIILRAANVYGPGLRMDRRQNAIGSAFASITNGRTFKVWGDGSATKDYVYISDVVNALVQSADLSTDDCLFNIGTGIGKSVLELIEIIGTVTGRALALEFENPRDVDPQFTVIDPGKAWTQMHWAPTVSLEEGLKRTWRWVEATQSCMSDHIGLRSGTYLT